MARKWVLGGLFSICLASLSSLVFIISEFPVISFKLHSGGAPGTFKGKELEGFSSSLKIGDKSISDFNLQPLSNIKHTPSSLKIDTDSRISIDFSNTQSLGITNNIISSAYREIKREEKALNVGNKVDQVISKSLKKLNSSDAKNFSTSVQKINSHMAPVDNRRRKRSALEDHKTPRLTRAEKQSMEKYYAEFLSLKDVKQNLLKEISSDGKSSKRRRSKRHTPLFKKTHEDIESLKKIGWVDDYLELFGGKEGKKRKDYPDPQLVRAWNNIACHDNNCGWGEWEKNPYKNFLWSQGEWKNFVDRITALQKKVVDNVDDSSKIMCSLFLFPGLETVMHRMLLWFFMKAFFNRNSEKIKRYSEGSCGLHEQILVFEEIEEAKRRLQFKIGSSLLEKMNLLDYQKIN